MTAAFGRGHIRDVGVTRTHILATGIQAAILPGAFDARRWAPPHLDQGITNTCFGHGTSGLLVTSHAQCALPLPWIPSPKGIYDLARAVDRAVFVQPDGTLPPLTDSGAQPNQGMRGIAEWGIRAMRGSAPDGRNSDCDPFTVNDEPKLDELEEERLRPQVGEYSIDGPARVEFAKKALVSGIGVGVGAFVDTRFEDWTPSQGAFGVADVSDPDGGGHWMYIVAYETLATGETVFWLRNSWGTAPGAGGDFLVSEAFITTAWDVIGLDPRAAAVPILNTGTWLNRRAFAVGMAGVQLA